MEFYYDNNVKYVNIEDVAIFLEYKRINQFINRIKSKANIIFDKFINVKDLIKDLENALKKIWLYIYVIII